jgi:catechol 2,3-dioxygenase-like lactoylglutathione lyase family enzyme
VLWVLISFGFNLRKDTNWRKENIFDFAPFYFYKTIVMELKAKSIRPFIGAKDYRTSRAFYCDLGFEEVIIASNLSLFQCGATGFYLQDAYVKDWVDNAMIFLEVDHVTDFWETLVKLDLSTKYEHVRIIPIKEYDWGKECFIHDPSGVLWHVGEFYK